MAGRIGIVFNAVGPRPSNVVTAGSSTIHVGCIHDPLVNNSEPVQAVVMFAIYGIESFLEQCY